MYPMDANKNSFFASQIAFFFLSCHKQSMYECSKDRELQVINREVFERITKLLQCIPKKGCQLYKAMLYPRA